MRQPTDHDHLLVAWPVILAERTAESIATLSHVPGIVALILAGSVGRDEPWPLSDIDLLLICEDDAIDQAAHEVETCRVALLDQWMDEGFGGTSLDVGKLRFGFSEIVAMLSRPPREAVHWLDDPRWFHSLDKGYHSRAVFDPTGLGGALAAWLTDARFAPEVTDARRRINRRQLVQRYREAISALHAGDPLVADVALRESIHVLMRYLMEMWGGRDHSFARFGSRFEQAARARGEGRLAEEIFAINRLAPAEVARRMAMAPEGIRYRHRLSFAARKLVDEGVSMEQDARDVLLVFGTMRMRRNQLTHEPWLGLETEAGLLAERMTAYEEVLKRVVIDPSPADL